MRLILGISTATTIGVVSALTVATAPAIAAESAAASQKRLDSVLGVLRILNTEVPAIKPKGPKHATGDLPRGRAVPLRDFRISALYGNRGPHTGGVHGGLDLVADTGDPIFAVAAGKVITAGWQGAAGKAVTIRTRNGKFILYGHMSKVLITEGKRVKAGQRIGRIGSTGNSTGPHLHLQVERPNGKGTIDPLPWLGVSKKKLGRFGRD